ncbi:MAG: hypothetical protein CVU08_05470 [Bacteroidetes bacterium HGW-Bacteroidetes-3]|jgi:uncharacterized membrane protein (DUF2068 family)|nr:MAG: hypothetical protein CVU08_05470 [Bacteroidetes bacterium HGW-Bacteroidetes-3]
MTILDFNKNKKSPSPREGFRMGIAAILALFIGGMSVVAGSKVLLGIDVKDYTVLNWLVIYNVIFGVISMVAAYLIWKKKSFAKKAIVFVLAAHTFVALNLYFFSETVASESLKAMSFRISIWIVIYLLTFKKFNQKPLN